MNQSETIEKLAEALAKAQGKIKNADKDSTNPHFKSKYADLASVWDACRGALSSYGLSVIQGCSGGPDTVTITTRLMHDSGQWIEDSLTLRPQQSTPQGIGSAVTYGKRYSLMGMVGVAPDDDDDGQAASQPTAPAARPTARPSQKPQPVPAAGGPLPEAPPTRDEAKHYALEITRMINAGLITPDDVRVYGSLPSISAAKEAGDVNSLKQAHMLLQEYVHAKNKELAAAS